MANVTVAKRNVGSLTDPSAAYQKIFSDPIKPEAAWKLVQKWRKAGEVLQKYSQSLSGRDLQLAVHGNRFIEHVLLRSEKPLDEKLASEIHKELKALVEEQHGKECYLAVLFKNTNKCEALELAMMVNAFL